MYNVMGLQVIMDSETFQGIHAHLPQLCTRILNIIGRLDGTHSRRLSMLRRSVDFPMLSPDDRTNSMPSTPVIVQVSPIPPTPDGNLPVTGVANNRSISFASSMSASAPSFAAGNKSSNSTAPGFSFSGVHGMDGSSPEPLHGASRLGQFRDEARIDSHSPAGSKQASKGTFVSPSVDSGTSSAVAVAEALEGGDVSFDTALSSSKSQEPRNPLTSFTNATKRMLQLALQPLSPKRSTSAAAAVASLLPTTYSPSNAAERNTEAHSPDQKSAERKSAERKRNTRNVDKERVPQNEKSVMVIDMGVHKLQGISEPVHLVQVMPPGLEARAKYFGPLSTMQQKTPGYFDAPATLLAPLPATGCDVHWQDVALPEVTLVFCAVENYNQMVALNR